MRKILFRGKDKDSGRWYTGGYVKLADTTYCFAEDYEYARMEGKDPEHHYIIFDEMTDWGLPNRHMRAEVIPESVSEFTGMRDMNGNPIFEHDIIRITNTYNGMNKADLHLVVYSGVGFVAMQGEMCNPLDGFSEYCRMEVVGNAIDNPDMLKEIPNVTAEDFTAALKKAAQEIMGDV